MLLELFRSKKAKHKICTYVYEHSREVGITKTFAPGGIFSTKTIWTNKSGTGTNTRPPPCSSRQDAPLILKNHDTYSNLDHNIEMWIVVKICQNAHQSIFF